MLKPTKALKLTFLNLTESFKINESLFRVVGLLTAKPQFLVISRIVFCGTFVRFGKMFNMITKLVNFKKLLKLSRQLTLR